MGKRERIAVYGTLVVLFVLAAVFDLSITQSLYDPGNWFGKLGELLGELPAYILGVFALSLITLHHPSGKKAFDLTLFWVFLVLGIGLSVYAGHHVYDTICRIWNTDFGTVKGLLMWIVISIPVFAAGFLPAKLLVKEEQRKEAFLFGVFVITTFAVSVLIMQATKMIWFRPRYRTLEALHAAGAIDNPASFWLPFYKPQLFTSFAKYEAGGEYGFTQAQINQAMGILGVRKWEMEEFYSFVSGHTIHSLLVAMLCYLPRVIPALEKKKRFGFIVRLSAYAFAALIGFTRILRGAHNATDVVGGFLIGFTVFDLGSIFFYERFLRIQFLAEPIPEHR